jgi:hypothetical protein
MKKINIEQVESSIAEELDQPLKAALKRHGYPIHESFRLRLSLLNAAEMQSPTLGPRKNLNQHSFGWSPSRRLKRLSPLE